MVYHFGIAHKTDREIVLSESRNIDVAIGAAVAALIVGLTLTRLAANDNWAVVALLGAVELGLLWCLILGTSESIITVSRDRMSVIITRNLLGVKVTRNYELDQVQRFYDVTATLRTGGGKGLRAELRSGQKISLSLWARSSTLKSEVIALTALRTSCGRQRTGIGARHCSP